LKSAFLPLSNFARLLFGVLWFLPLNISDDTFGKFRRGIRIPKNCPALASGVPLCH
jgi:hypothetical protein